MGKYISCSETRSFLAAITFPNTVYYSDIDNGVFPDGINNFDVDLPLGTQITGQHQPTKRLRSLDKSIQILFAGFSNANFRVDQLRVILGVLRMPLFKKGAVN